MDYGVSTSNQKTLASANTLGDVRFGDNVINAPGASRNFLWIAIAVLVAGLIGLKIWKQH